MNQLYGTMILMPDPNLPHGQLPPIPEGCGIMPIAENRIARGPRPELLDALPEGFDSLYEGSDSTAPILRDALEQTYRRVLARALGIAACALFLASLTAATLIRDAPQERGYLGAALYFRAIFVIQLLFMSFCNRYIEKLAIAPAALLLSAYAVVSALEFSILVSPLSLAVAFLCAGLMYGSASLFAFRRHFDLARPVTGIFMILAGGAILVTINLLLQTPSSVWTLSSLAVVVFACLAGHYAQQIRDFHQEFNDDNAEGWKASVLGALLLLINSVNVYLLVASFLPRDDDREIDK